MKRHIAECRLRIRDFFIQRGAAFWIKWCLTVLALSAAALLGGNMFVMIALGGALGVCAALMLDAFDEYRQAGVPFGIGNMCITIVACCMGYAAFFYPASPHVVLGCFASSGLMLTLLLKRLDPEAGVNIQVGLLLAAVLGALAMAFYYTAAYAEWVRPLLFVVAAAVYVWMLARLKNGAEVGLRAAWFLAIGIGLALFAAAGMVFWGIAADPVISFAGLATGLAVGTLLHPIRLATGWVCEQIAKEREYRSF